MAFDSIQVRFQDVRDFKSPFAGTRVVPFVGSYLQILKSVVKDVTTEYFWFFANFMDMKTVEQKSYTFCPKCNSRIREVMISMKCKNLQQKRNSKLLRIAASIMAKNLVFLRSFFGMMT